MSLWIYHENADDYTTYQIASPDSYYSMFSYERNTANVQTSVELEVEHEGTNELTNGEWKCLLSLHPLVLSGYYLIQVVEGVDDK